MDRRVVALLGFFYHCFTDCFERRERIYSRETLRCIVGGEEYMYVLTRPSMESAVVAPDGWYLYSWQSNEEVEEDISRGRRRLVDRMGSTRDELRHARRDVGAGMMFAGVVTYFIMLSTAATLFKAGKHDINSAAEAAQALAPIAGKLSETLFALGVFSVGLLAVPVMITGAAYDLCQSFGWKHGLHYSPAEVKKFSASIAAFTVLAVGLNFLGINPMKALVFSSIVQGISTPFLMLLIMLITTNRHIMDRCTNTNPMN